MVEGSLRKKEKKEDATTSRPLAGKKKVLPTEKNGTITEKERGPHRSWILPSSDETTWSLFVNKGKKRVCRSSYGKRKKEQGKGVGQILHPDPRRRFAPEKKSDLAKGKRKKKETRGTAIDFSDKGKGQV